MSTAGCIDQLPFLGDEPLEFSASPASIPDPVLEETGYDEQEIEEVVVEETFESTGQTQDVIVTNWQGEYDKAIDLSELPLSSDETVRAAVVTTLSTPQVRVLGRTFNPVADVESAELAEMVQDRYGGVEGLEQVGEESVPVAGESTTVGEFEGQARHVGEGVSIDLTLHIAEAVESGDDFIVGVGGYPTRLRERERSHVFSMLEGIEHDD
ncbi:MAG: DUF6517 family protein [Halanaeroarchaeum sp.]